MISERPYKHILKNLFHEQAFQIVPLLLPEIQVTQAFEVEIPELRTKEIPVARKVTHSVTDEMAKGLVGMVMPGAEITGIIETEWIEHSGKFERAYRIKHVETTKPAYLLIEFQLDRGVIDPPLILLCNFIQVYGYARNDVASKAVEDVRNNHEYDAENSEEIERQSRGTAKKPSYYVYPYMLCPFPKFVPQHYEQSFQGEVTHSFKFLSIELWEHDAREFLNRHESAIYFLLPAMKNADAMLLGLAIEELAQKFQNDDKELGRHLTGLQIMLQESEVMSDEEKQLAQAYLEPFAHLLKNDAVDE